MGNREGFERKRAKSKKINDKLTYNPAKHKQQKTRNLRQKLQLRTLSPNPPAPPPPQTIKFGSINVNGLDVEAAWAVEKLLKDRKFDVSPYQTKIQ